MIEPKDLRIGNYYHYRDWETDDRYLVLKADSCFLEAF